MNNMKKILLKLQILKLKHQTLNKRVNKNQKNKLLIGANIKKIFIKHIKDKFLI